MSVSATVLGSNGDVSLAEVGKRIADYLEGGRTRGVGAQQSREVQSQVGSGDGVAAYYADSAGPRPGQWILGHTAQDRAGEVDARELATLLAGKNPTTGEPLISVSGSAGRALSQRGEAITSADLDHDWYLVGEAAQVLGVSASYLRKVLRREEFKGCDASAITVDHRGRKLLSKDLVASIAENRKPPRVVAGYDLTFSPVKSVSVLWAGGDEQTREAILDALDASVATGLRYLERNAFAVRTKGQTEPAGDLIAADYLHTTSRALEPQLHHHVVIANVGTGMDGVPRALDARQIFHHAKTSSYLAAAELRHQLTTRLGVSWTKVENGLAEIEGIPETAISEMSSRSKEIAAKTTQLGVHSAKARQVAAWSTRAAKQHGVDEAKLVVSWDERLTAAGFGVGEREAVLGKVEAPEPWSLTAKERLFTQLLRVDGLTEHTAVFDRRHVVQCLADCVGDRLPGDLIDELADELLARPEVVELESTGEGNKVSQTLIQRGDGQTVSMSSHQLYTTEAMLALEQRALDAYERGRANSLTSVAPELIEAVLDRAEFARLSDEQRAFVASLTGSSMRIQAGVGAAGSGKTTALKAAVAIWREAGYQVIGAAVGGTQAVVLSEETGIETRTVASVLARYFDHGDVAIVNDHTVLLVDEASLLSTKDFAALTRIAGERGALLRVIGDPAQHSSVNAGGIFRHIVEQHSDETPALTHLYRQQGAEMEEVRLANAEYREGQITKALERLARDGRITEANSAEEAYDLLTCAWYVERQKRIDDPDRRYSAMTAEHHFERRELNVRARVLLTTDGTLSGPELRVGELAFQVGDEVIARVPDRSLRANDAIRDAYVRNGSLGTVTGVYEESLVVDFKRWGRVEVPISYLTQRLPSGIVGGLQHAYALTTHAAQGETFAVATPLVTDASSLEGVYVGITRGQFDLQGVVIRRRELTTPLTDDDLPILRDDTSAMRSTQHRLEQSDPERLASEFARVDRSESPDSQDDVGKPFQGSADVRSSENLDDAELLERLKVMKIELHAARVDVVRIETDLARRQKIISHASLSQRETGLLEEAITGAREHLLRLGDLRADLTLEIQAMKEEIDGRGIVFEIMGVVTGKAPVRRIEGEELQSIDEVPEIKIPLGPMVTM